MSPTINRKQRSLYLFRLIGYGLLVLAVIDVIYIVVPPRFTNPAWEFETIGQLIEHAPVSLIGLVFLFYRENSRRTKVERILLQVISWSTLAIGILFFLLIPLVINDSFRIHYNNGLQLNQQLAQQTNQLRQLENQLNQADSKAEISQLLATRSRQSRVPDIKNPQALKNQLLSEIATAQSKLQAQFETTRADQRLTLVKSTCKGIIGALVTGALFTGIWLSTKWARHPTR